MERKRKVMGVFAAIFVFGVLLVLLQYSRFGGLNAFVLQGEENQEVLYETGGFDVFINDYDVDGGEIILYYQVNELKSKSYILEASYELYQRGKIIGSESEEIVIEANSEHEYVSRFDLPQNFVGEGELFLEFSNQEDRYLVKKSIYLGKNRLTGNVISDGDVRNISISVIVLFFILVVLFAIKMIVYRRKIEQADKRQNRRLIKLDV